MALALPAGGLARGEGLSARWPWAGSFARRPPAGRASAISSAALLRLRCSDALFWLGNAGIKTRRFR
jgi:hypothetical protein